MRFGRLARISGSRAAVQLHDISLFPSPCTYPYRIDLELAMEDLNAVLSRLGHLNLSDQVDDIQPTNGVGASCDVFAAHLKNVNNHGTYRTKVTVKKLRVSDFQRDLIVKVRIPLVAVMLLIISGLQKIDRELRAWSGLGHRNLLPLLGFSWENGELYLVSERMEKGSLHDYLPYLTQELDVVNMVRCGLQGLLNDF